MAHKLEERDAQYGVIQAWHGLTKIVELITPEIAFPWGVLLAPVSYELPDGKKKAHGSYHLPIADDDFLPLGSGVPINLDSYTLRCPKDLWKLRDAVVTGTENLVVSAGTVQNRAKFFISTKLVELEKVKLDDGSEMELLLNSMGSMDKSLNEQHSISSTRIVCNNTLMMSFLRDTIKFRYRHSKNMSAKIDADKPLIEKVAGFSAIVKATFDSLLAEPCDKDRAERVYTGLIASDGQETVSSRARGMIDEHITAFQRGDGNAGKTEFDLLNGWTQPKTRGYSDSEKSKWDTFETSEFGAYANQKTRLADLLVNDRPALSKIEQRGAALLAGKVQIVTV